MMKQKASTHNKNKRENGEEREMVFYILRDVLQACFVSKRLHRIISLLAASPFSIHPSRYMT